MSNNFAQIFQELDQPANQFNIKKYNIRVDSLEEVFIEIGDRELKE